MTQVSKPVQMVVIDEVCDKCGKGMMRPTGSTDTMSDPMVYGHKCTECDHTEQYQVQYPTTGYQLIPQVEAQIKAAHDKLSEQPTDEVSGD